MLWKVEDNKSREVSFQQNNIVVSADFNFSSFQVLKYTFGSFSYLLLSMLYMLLNA